ncbi:hypothetical protein FH972_022897 [Carpinus fangiana]|uniref:glucan endo-1,6-beta-glucosidase n=1 Tax=Carpinus fangiana TaxID=176857 RepID=A0A5N6KTW7_9ROSI|nr:hypothetical protein FH972_022897 [Carpinus fangiana]
MLSKSLVAAATVVGVAHAWLPWDRDMHLFNGTARAVEGRSLPDVTKIRGVNLGSWLVAEPWMMGNSWSDMGCSDQCSEFDCMSSVYGSDRATGNQKFQDHWANWIKPSDLDTIKSWGLNTIRIPVGYWIYRDIVDDSEPFAEGQLDYLDAMVAHAQEIGLFVVMDLHGAPYAQKPGDAFTGQCAGSAGFFQQSQYDRAAKFLGWMANRIHSTPDKYGSTGILEVVNEPLSDHDNGGQTDDERNTLTQNFYPQALQAVRDAEAALNVPAEKQLHVQFMDKQWQSGDPKASLPADSAVMLDDHNYVKGALGSGKQQGDYMYYSCFTDNRQDSADGDSPKAVQEWSLTVNDETTPEFDTNSQQYFYQSWFAAQVQLYEKTNGWIYWSLRNEFNDYRWSYELAVQNNIVPTDSAGLDAVQTNGICQSWFPNN